MLTLINVKGHDLFDMYEDQWFFFITETLTDFTKFSYNVRIFVVQLPTLMIKLQVTDVITIHTTMLS
jgi:hypothetical protein